MTLSCHGQCSCGQHKALKRRIIGDGATKALGSLQALAIFSFSPPVCASLSSLLNIALQAEFGQSF